MGIISLNLLHPIALNQKMINNLKIGVMQGRLLPKYKGRYQAHPVGYWQEEFKIASLYNLYCIEFILDYNLFEKNPLMSDDGIEEIKRQVDEHGVKVESICADYFMNKSFHDIDIEIVKESEIVMCMLLKNCYNLNIKNIVIPCVDNSSLKTEDDIKRFVLNTQRIADLAEKYDINLSLETDLNPINFSQLLSELKSSKFTVNYDTGNSASLGYNVTEEFSAYGNRITDIHIKDRKYEGGPVMLGEGNVDFESFFDALKNICYDGLIIMQAYRDDEGLEVFEKQLSFINKQLIEFKN